MRSCVEYQENVSFLDLISLLNVDALYKAVIHADLLNVACGDLPFHGSAFVP